MRAFKALWDPHNRMNPGKVVDPHPITAFIRPGPGYHPDKPATHYSYAEDEHDFRRTALRCVGVGKCRHAGQDVMCPSYLATREEKHSTRGRARLLFEMMHGGVITDGWRSDAVHEALDLCLSCKGCKHDCPVNVDMATYKSEFHAHYYAGRLRPRTAYSMGLIHWWSRAAARAPGLVNAVTQNRLMAPAVKWIAGIAGERQLPRYAPATLQAEAARRGSLNGNRPSVMLFPDTFNNHFHPRTGLAAMRVLEAAGYHVIVPPEPICCGRPLYAWGMLDLARKQLTRVMEVLSPYVEQHLPIVGLEPACLTSLVDELPALFPEDPRARALAAASMTFPGFLTERAHWTPPRRPGRALVHPHCYEHAVLGTGSLMGLLEAAGMEARLSQAGCCGMAGSFGFEHDHYQVAVACGERSLLPQVRQAAPGTVMIANGFACREQIAQGSGRDALHLADVLAQGLDQAQPQPGERHGDRQQDLGDRRRLHPGG
jgi:Fe-S oxidoreductase